MGCLCGVSLWGRGVPMGCLCGVSLWGRDCLCGAGVSLCAVPMGQHHLGSPHPLTHPPPPPNSVAVTCSDDTPPFGPPIAVGQRFPQGPQLHLCPYGVSVWGVPMGQGCPYAVSLWG